MEITSYCWIALPKAQIAKAPFNELQHNELHISFELEHRQF